MDTATRIRRHLEIARTFTANASSQLHKALALINEHYKLHPAEDAAETAIDWLESTTKEIENALADPTPNM
jgi:type IV secretory pathway ATPase VirB11/archaellum biosynthesis ATPase